MYADYRFATIGGKAVKDLINDQVWNADVFLPTVGKRGAAIIDARGLSSAASAANAAIDHMRDWALGTNGEGTIQPGDIDLNSTDNCGVDTMYLSQSTFDCQDLGQNAVTLTVVDVNGNSNFCTVNVTVTAGTNFGFSRNGLQQNTRQLTDKDVEAIRALATSVSLLAPDYSANATVVYQGKTTNTSVSGVTADYATVRNWSVERGRFISPEDNTNLAMVVILGQTVVENLFGSTLVNPVGEVVRINRQTYEVVGVLKTKGQSGFNNQDNTIFMPLRTAQIKLGGAGTTEVRSISLQVRSAEEMDLAQAQVTAILRTLHGLQTGAENDFTVQNQADILSTVAQTTGTFTTLLGSIAAISLLVGGIGIMTVSYTHLTLPTSDLV